MKAYILSAFPEPPIDFNNFGFLWLRESATQDAFGRHQLTDDPQNADIILFVENHAHDDPYLLSVRCHPIFREFSDKCFLYHDDDYAVPVLRGIYPSIQKRDYLDDRCRSAGYIARIVQNDAIVYDPRPRKRKWLYSFFGEENSAVRAAIFAQKHPHGLVRNTTGARLWQMDPGPSRDLFVNEYAEALNECQFVLCPRGNGPATFRLFEAMEMGRAPVILSDEWVSPSGPRWDKFSVRIPEASSRDIPSILSRVSSRHEEMGREARNAWEKWFSKPVCFHRLIDLCVELQSTPRRRFSAMRAWGTLLRAPHFRNYLRPQFRRTEKKIRSTFGRLGRLIKLAK